MVQTLMFCTIFHGTNLLCSVQYTMVQTFNVLYNIPWYKPLMFCTIYHGTNLLCSVQYSMVQTFNVLYPCILHCSNDCKSSYRFTVDTQVTDQIFSKLSNILEIGTEKFMSPFTHQLTRSCMDFIIFITRLFKRK
jgi:hypothetical protein